MTTGLSPSQSALLADIRRVIIGVISPDATVLLAEETGWTGAFTQAVSFTGVGPIPVVAGQDNRVSAPPADPGYIVITPVSRTRLSTNVSTYFDSGHVTGGSIAVGNNTRLAVQIDCYGVDSGDWSTILSIVFRDEFACDMMTVGQPLYADDPIQMPLVDGEEQYEERWTVQAMFQYAPWVSLPMQFGDTVSPVNLFPVEVTPKAPADYSTALVFHEANGTLVFGQGVFFN